MSTTLSPSSPMSSGEIPIIDTQRGDAAANRHAMLTKFMAANEFDGILLQDPANFSWLTCGGDNVRRGNSSDPVASILVTADARVVLCNNVDSGQIFDRELMGLGFQLKERPWLEDANVLRLDVCRGRKVASDRPIVGANFPLVDLRPLRQQLESTEQQQIRELGHDVTHAVEATARNFEAGASEAEIAGHLAHRMLKRQIEPVSIQVMADAQGWRYRHWCYGLDRIERHCVISTIARRNGLHVGVTRTVSIGEPSEELQKTHSLATIVQATGMYFTQVDWTMEQTWKRVARIYEKFDVPDEWRVAEQAEILGYGRGESQIHPQAQETFQSGMAVYWHPSVRAALVGDTMLVNSTGGEILTVSQNWPVISVKVKDVLIERPSILIREFAPQA